MTEILLINSYEKFSHERLTQWVKAHPEHQFTIYQEQGINESEVVSKHPGTHILICTYGNYNKQLLEKMPQLKAVIATTTAKEYIDLEYCKKNDIAFFNTAGYTGAAVAEHLLALLFVLTRKLTPKLSVSAQDVPATELFGKTVGILGYGHIGKQVTKMLQALSMYALIFNRSPILEAGVQQMNLEELLPKAQVLICTLPLTAETHGLINEKRLDLLPKGAFIVSTSPSNIFDLSSLKSRLHSGALGGVAMDHHGLDADWADTPHFFSTPAIAWYTKECVDRRTETFLKSLDRFLF